MGKIPDNSIPPPTVNISVGVPTGMFTPGVTKREIPVEPAPPVVVLPLSVSCAGTQTTKRKMSKPIE
jgi:hypothetical protein